ncbi:hypothetical protein GTU99_08755 [Streptomyces sp. PRKS01-65]|nr:hypothetical protein [Streptomyces harenosi]
MTAVGTRPAVAEPRISAAGFFAGGCARCAVREQARRVTVPPLFLLPWDDEGSDRRRALDLLDASGSQEKALRADLGGRAGAPWFEVDDAARFFARHLR